MTLAILAVAGVASIVLFSVKGSLDQVPDVIDSATRARDAWHRFKSAGDESPRAEDEEELPPANDQGEPPAAA